MTQQVQSGQLTSLPQAIVAPSSIGTLLASILPIIVMVGVAAIIIVGMKVFKK